MADEFNTPKEFTTPSEFPKIKEVFISAPEFLDRPIGYGTTERKKTAEGKSKSSQIRKMMMYLAATVTTMGSVLMFSTEAQEQKFDMKEYIKTHRDWYIPEEDEYIYLGDNGLAWIALRSEDGQVFNDFYHYKKWRYLSEETGEYTFRGYGYDIDWSGSELDSKKAETACRFVETADGYIMEAYDPNNPSVTQKIYPLDPSKADYPGKQYMLKYLDVSMKDILNEFNTYVMENDAPVYTHIEKIVFNPDGTGTFRIKGKERKFTYEASEDKADNFITIKFNGRSARACFNFYGERPTMLFFGGLENDPRSFAAFKSVDPANAEKNISSNKHINSGENNLPPSPDDPDETIPSKDNAKPVDASYLKVKRNWYCKELQAYVFFGENGEGHLYTTKDPSSDSYHKRFKYKISGSTCEFVVENFNFPSMTFKTDTMSVTTMKVGDEVQVWLKSVVDKGENHVFTEYSGNLRNYLDDINGMNTDDILVKYRSFHIVDEGPIQDGYTRLEFTGKNKGNIYWLDQKGEFTYSISGNGINSTFNLYFKGERYPGWLFFSENKPGILLFNPWLDGTHGRFIAD